MHAADARLPQASACVATLTPREADYLQRRGTATGRGERLAQTEAKPGATKRMGLPTGRSAHRHTPRSFSSLTMTSGTSQIIRPGRMICSGERLLEEV